MKLATLASAAAVLLSAFTGTVSASGLRGVAVTSDSADYDENYYVPEDYGEDYEFNVEEEPLDLDSFDEDLDDEDLDSDMKLYGWDRRFGSRRGFSTRRGIRLKERAANQLEYRGYIPAGLADRLSNGQIRRAAHMVGLSPNQLRQRRNGQIAIRRRYGGIGPRRRYNRFHNYD